MTIVAGAWEAYQGTWFKPLPADYGQVMDQSVSTPMVDFKPGYIGIIEAAGLGSLVLPWSREVAEQKWLDSELSRCITISLPQKKGYKSIKGVRAEDRTGVDYMWHVMRNKLRFGRRSSSDRYEYGEERRTEYMGVEQFSSIDPNSFFALGMLDYFALTMSGLHGLLSESHMRSPRISSPYAVSGGATPLSILWRNTPDIVEFMADIDNLSTIEEVLAIAFMMDGFSYHKAKIDRMSERYIALSEIPMSGVERLFWYQYWNYQKPELAGYIDSITSSGVNWHDVFALQYQGVGIDELGLAMLAQGVAIDFVSELSAHPLPKLRWTEILAVPF